MFTNLQRINYGLFSSSLMLNITFVDAKQNLASSAHQLSGNGGWENCVVFTNVDGMTGMTGTLDQW